MDESGENRDEPWFGFENQAFARNEAKRLYEEAKTLVSEEKYTVALHKLREADLIHPLQKHKKRIHALEKFLRDCSNNSFASEECFPTVSATKNKSPVAKKKAKTKHSEDSPKLEVKSKMVSSEYTEVVKGFKVKKAVFDRLYDYQVDGIKWLYKLFVQEAGGILADDMGLGKTIQTIALLSSLLYFDKIKSVLIVAPSTLLINWGKEFRSWAPDVKVFKFDGSVSSNVRLRALENVQRNGGVLLTTYDLCRNYADTFSQCDWRQFIWDYFILDEGHKIKNPTKTTKAIYNIPSRHRLVITGTPVQNKLKELWALYDFAMKGTLLGTYRSFKMRYEDPITKGLSKDAMMKDMIKANKIAENLRQIYEPYFLRREKQEIFNSNRDLKLKLPIKIDWVVWIRLTQEQINVYRDFIALDSIKELILRENKKSIFLHILTLKKICDHLRLLSKNVCEQLLSKNDSLSENEMEKIIEEDQMVNIEVPDEILIAESGKLAFCLDLLEELKEKNHRVLLFSQSTKMLDIIQKILTNRKWKIARLDGRVTNLQRRDEIVRTFQNDSSIPICLLTSQVGGVGLTLTGADRVIIYDPSWNPGTDSQAIDRAYRIGQKKDVIVYRLITCGTVEEKIYQRQIFKNSITKQTIENESNPMRYFSSAELAELFEFSNSSFSKTYEHIAEIHGTNHNYSDYVSTHLDFVKHLHRVYNISDHNKMFSTQELPLEEEPEIMQHINQEVQGAEAVITQESRATKQILVETGEFRRPLQLNVLDRRNVKAIDNYVPLENPTPIIDLCDSSDECESDIFEKPVKLKDFEEEKENFEKVYKELGRNSKSVDDSSILEASIKTVSDIIERIDLSEKAASTKNISDLREKMEEDIKSECSKVLSDILEHSFLSESSEHSKNGEDNHSKEIFSHDSIEEDDEFESSKNVISDLLNLVSDISENNHSAKKANEANKHSDRQMSLEKESLEEDSFLESSKTVLSDILGKLDDSCDEKRSELIFEEKHGEDSSMINAESMNFDKFNDSDSYIIGCGQRKKNVLNSTILESSMSAISNILKVSETNESLEATRKIEDSSIISDEPRSQFSDKSKEEHSFSDEDEILGYDDSGRIDNIANISGNIRKWIEPCLESTRICTKKAKVAYFPSIDLSPNENTPEIDRWQKNTTRDSTKGMGITNENNHNMGTNVLSKFMQDEDLISKRENLPRTEKKRPVLTNLDKLRNLPRMRQSI